MYKTSLGRVIEYPYRLMSQLAMHKNDKLRELVSVSKCMFDEIQRLDLHISKLIEENTRLKHENEFMLRLINERD